MDLLILFLAVLRSLRCKQCGGQVTITLSSSCESGVDLRVDCRSCYDGYFLSSRLLRRGAMRLLKKALRVLVCIFLVALVVLGAWAFLVIVLSFGE